MPRYKKIFKLLKAYLKLSLVGIFPADAAKPPVILYIIGTILQ